MKATLSSSWKCAFLLAWPRTLPICAAFCSIGISYGFLMDSLGFPWYYPTLMSMLIFAGAMEFVTIQLLFAPFNPLHALLLTLIVNARHLFYAITMLDKFKDCGLKKLYLIFGMCDETFAINCSAMLPPEVDRGRFMTCVTALNHCYWVAGATVGAVAGSFISFNSEGIEFMMTALFTVIVLEQWDSTTEHRPALLGMLIGSSCLLMLGPKMFVVAALGGIVLTMLLMRPLFEHDASVHQHLAMTSKE